MAEDIQDDIVESDLDDRNKEEGNEGDPNLDGDFVVLNALRRRTLQRLETPSSSVENFRRLAGKSAWSDFSSILAKDSFQNVVRQKRLEQQQRLFEAAKEDDVNKFKALYDEVIQGGKTLVASEMRDPVSSETVLLHALINKSTEVTQFLVDVSDEELVKAEFEVRIKGISAKRSAIHILAARGDTGTAKVLLSKLSTSAAVKAFLMKETLVKPPGQRPRHLAPIHIAAWKGRENFLRLLVDYGINVNQKNNKNDTPILWATRLGHSRVVHTLIDMGADVNASNDKGSSPIYWAVRYGYIDLVSSLLKQTKAVVNVNTKRKLGLVCPLVLASALGYSDMVAQLADHGADVNTTIRGGETALHQASGEGHVTTAKVLLARKANKNAQTEHGLTSLMVAAKANQAEMVAFLIENDADPDILDKEGHSVWFHAIEAESKHALESLVLSSVKKGYVEVYGEGAHERICFKEGKSPLHYCAEIGDNKKLQNLLELGVDPYLTDVNGSNFTHIAALHDQTHIIKDLQKDININKVNKNGDTPLHLACYKGHHATSKALIARNTNLTTKNSLGKTPLQVAAEASSASEEMVKDLVAYTIKTQNWSLMDDTDSNGNTALHSASLSGRAGIVQELRDLNIKLTNKDGNTALHLAIKHQHLQVFETLMNINEKRGRDMNLNEPNKSGDTLLHLAAVVGNRSMIESLLAAGADISIPDSNGDTVLHLLTKNALTTTECPNPFTCAFDAVLARAGKWWAIKTMKSYPKDDKDERMRLERGGILLLTSRLFNKQELTVVNLAAKIGNEEIMQKLTNLQNVYRFEQDNHVIFDITHFTPTLLNSVRSVPECFKSGQKAGVDRSSQFIKQHHRSSLEYIVKLVPNRATVMLDIPAFTLIESSYGAACFWVFFALLLLHVTFMGCYSYYSIPMVTQTLQNNSQIPQGSTTNPLTPAIYFLLWPIICFLFEVIYFSTSFCKIVDRRAANRENGEKGKSTESRPWKRDMVGHYASIMWAHLGVMGFAFGMLLWFLLYYYNVSHHEYMLAVALIFGWMFTISFTRGFKAVHHFSRMLNNIIMTDITRFSFVYICVLMAFTFAIHALLQAVPSVAARFPNAIHTMFLVFNLMIGMGELFDDQLEVEFEAVGQSTVFLKVVYLLYIILSTIILLNLLIAMMSDSYKHIQDTNETDWRVKAVRLGLEVEKAIPFIINLLFRGVKIEKRVLKLDGVNDHRFFLRVPDSKVNRILKRMHSPVDDLASKMATLQETVYQMQEKLDRALVALEAANVQSHTE